MLNNSFFFFFPSVCVCAWCTTGMLLSQVSDMTCLINGVTQPANIIPTTKSVSPAGPQGEGTCSTKSKEAKLVSRLCLSAQPGCSSSKLCFLSSRTSCSILRKPASEGQLLSLLPFPLSHHLQLPLFSLHEVELL